MNIGNEDLLKSYVPDLPISDILRLEGLPNRNSLSYSNTYDIHPKDGLHTLFRGTLRFVVIYTHARDAKFQKFTYYHKIQISWIFATNVELQTARAFRRRPRTADYQLFRSHPPIHGRYPEGLADESCFLHLCFG